MQQFSQKKSACNKFRDQNQHAASSTYKISVTRRNINVKQVSRTKTSTWHMCLKFLRNDNIYYRDATIQPRWLKFSWRASHWGVAYKNLNQWTLIIIFIRKCMKNVLGMILRIIGFSQGKPHIFSVTWKAMEFIALRDGWGCRVLCLVGYGDESYFNWHFLGLKVKVEVVEIIFQWWGS